VQGWKKFQVKKFQINIFKSNVEIIDITEKIVYLYEPLKNMKEKIQKIPKTEPIKDAFLLDD